MTTLDLLTKVLVYRAKLANLKVAVPSNVLSTKEGKLWQETGMIGLLCSLFLLKQGAGEAAEAIENKRALEVLPRYQFRMPYCSRG
jgi:hypothetical protein